MNSPVCGLRVASIIAGFGSVAHLVRFFLGFQVNIGGQTVPVWFSGPGFVVLGLLSFWFWKLALAAKSATPSTSAPA